MARIYLASSWRNARQPSLVRALRDAGHEVYDFHNPPNGLNGGSHWADTGALLWAVERQGLEWCDTCVLSLPCGRKAHLELGSAEGRGKRTIILAAEGHRHPTLNPADEEPDRMYLFADGLVADVDELLGAL